MSIGPGLMAVSHQFPRGNQARNHCHQKVYFQLAFVVFPWFWLSFELIWVSLMGVTFVDSNR